MATRIRTEIVQQIGHSEDALYLVSKSVNRKMRTIRNWVKLNSPLLTLPDCQAAIRSALGLPSDENITETVQDSVEVPG